MADEEIVLVCMPADRPAPDPSSTREYCMECADPVWMSGRMHSFWHDNESARVLCAPCAVEIDDFKSDVLPGDEVGRMIHRSLPMDQIMRAIYKRRDPPQP